MSPSEHAKLSPSDSARWISCPAAIGVDAEMKAQGLLTDDGDSSYAAEGTTAHALGEIKAAHAFGLIGRAEYLQAMEEWTSKFYADGYSDATLSEMIENIKGYVALIGAGLKANPGSKLMLEQRMDSGVERCWGTSDTVIVGPTHIEIIDLKYGAGVMVSAIENSQLRLYACGALDTFGTDKTVLVVMTVFQPRASDEPSTEEMHPDELRKWREEVVKPKAAEALHSDNPSFGPSEKACRWCPAAGLCKARIEQTVMEDFGDILAEAEPEPKESSLITLEELALVLHRVPAIKAWCSAVEAAGLDAAFGHGKTIPGWKVVRPAGRRGINDHAGAIEALLALGYTREEVANEKTKGIGELEKLMSKPEFKIISKFVTIPEGKETLVVESDKRSAINSASEAAKDFA